MEEAAIRQPLFILKNTEPMSARRCFGLLHCHRPSKAAAKLRSDRRYRNPLAVDALESRLCCRLAGDALDVRYALSSPHGKAAAPEQDTIPLLEDFACFVGAVVSRVPVPGCGDRNRRAVECNGYTYWSPACQKTCHACHLCGPHGSFQLLDPLAA